MGYFVAPEAFHFTTFWDPTTGLPVDKTLKTRITTITDIQDISLFFDSLVTKDFGAIITNDPTTSTPCIRN